MTPKDTWNPDQYHRFQKERAQPFHDLLALLQPVEGGTAVDLGCGSGELTTHLHQTLKLKHTVGIDSSSAMLEKAKSHATANLTFEQGRIEDFRAQTEYDLIFSNAALQWCSDHQSLLSNFKQALKPGGQLAIQMPMNHDYPTHLLARQMRMEAPYAPFFSALGADKNPMLTPETYALILFKLGFQTRRVYTEVYSHVLGNRSEVIEWVKGTLLTPFQAHLPPPIYALFLDEYRNRLFEMLPDEEPFFYPFKRLFIWARDAGH